MSDFPAKIFKHKQLMSRPMLKSVLRKLTREPHIESALRSLCAHPMDEFYEESQAIAAELVNLFDHPKYGSISHWCYRKWMNRYGEARSTLEPPQLFIPPRCVAEEPKAYRNHEKAKSLGSELVRWRLRAKLEKDPDALNREREEELFMEMLTPMTITDDKSIAPVKSSFSRFFAPPSC